jgi:hypothetical protein
MAPPPGWVGTRQFDQLLFHISADLDFVWSRWLWLMVDGYLQPLGHQALPHALYRPQAGAQSGNDLVVEAIVTIGQEKDAGVRESPGCRLSGGNQLLQLVPFLRR